MSDLILGLDPGSRRTGYGLVSAQGDRVQYLAHGIIQIDERKTFSERLHELFSELESLFNRLRPSITVVESIFFGKNADSVFKLGHARGVCLLAAARHKCHVAEYAPRFVKKCVTGSGAASKESVAATVFMSLGLQNHDKQMPYDASDALSLAVTHARVRETESRMNVRANVRMVNTRGALEESK